MAVPGIKVVRNVDQAEDNRTWYYAGSDKKQHTATFQELQALFSKGVITRKTLVWAKNEIGWAKLENVDAFKFILGAHNDNEDQEHTVNLR